MTYESFKLDLKQIKLELQRAVVECSQRGLNNSAKWLAELNFSLIDVKVDPQDANQVKENLVNNEADNYMLAKSYFDFQEYDRCAYFTEWCKSPLPRFLHLYSRYLSGEKKRLEDMRDTAAPLDHTQVSSLQDLASDLRKDYLNRSLDGFCLYLYGIVQKRLDLSQGALEVLVEATHKEPLHWGAWLELVTLITDRTKLDSLVLPDHWMKHFFLGHMYLDLQLNDDALNIYCMLRTQGFEKCHYILAQTAIVHHNNRDVDMAINTFRQLQKADPFRLENLDTYSNLLYVKDLKVELASLAHQACEIDKYRVETCCVIGNYYSLRAEHQKAVLYFQRALKRNPQYLSAWTLMGHEFMEMKNTNAAIQSYRKAIEINRRDYRAWYGLGQTYEILKMAHYCIYYYKQAQQLRPNDSRMLIALGETYEKLDKNTDAVKCYYRAHNVGDSEGTALLKVAKLFDKLNENEYAVAAYMGYVKESENRVIGDKSELYQAYKYLANHYLKVDQLEDAYQFAQKCLECEETKEEGKALLRSIAQKRSQLEESDMQMEDGTPSNQVRNRVSESGSNQSSLMNLTFG